MANLRLIGMLKVIFEPHHSSIMWRIAKIISFIWRMMLCRNTVRNMVSMRRVTNSAMSTFRNILIHITSIRNTISTKTCWLRWGESPQMQSGHVTICLTLNAEEITLRYLAWISWLTRISVPGWSKSIPIRVCN
jgi:hypothetical protein